MLFHWSHNQPQDPWDPSCSKSLLIAGRQSHLAFRLAFVLVANTAFSFLTSKSFNKRLLSEFSPSCFQAVLSLEFSDVPPACELQVDVNVEFNDVSSRCWTEKLKRARSLTEPHVPRIRSSACLSGPAQGSKDP